MAPVRSQLPAVHGQLQPDPFDAWRWDTTLDPSQKMMGCTWWFRILYKPWWDVQPWWEIVCFFFPHDLILVTWLNLSITWALHTSGRFDHLYQLMKRRFLCELQEQNHVPNHDPLQESDFVPPRTRVYMCSWPWLTTASSIGCWWDKTKSVPSVAIRQDVRGKLMDAKVAKNEWIASLRGIMQNIVYNGINEESVNAISQIFDWVDGFNKRPLVLLSWFWNFLGERKAQKSQKRSLHQTA